MISSFRLMLRKIRSLPVRVRLVRFILLTILCFYISFRMGDYTLLVSYLASSFAASIMCRLNGEYVEW